MDQPPKILLRSPRFWSFLGAQFLGAANDNAFKVTLARNVVVRILTELARGELAGGAS